jgi:2-polyprenyl-3-methyl-5-hydroxy-6-metoxy-1,4-benzoquinol methylase
MADRIAYDLVRCNFPQQKEIITFEAMKDKAQKEWFSEWFDTPYYHILYSNRNDEEAEQFIRNLISFLQPDPKTAGMLDLACGKGRHSVSLNKLGFKVKGLDLSPQSIAAAKQFENNNLTFDVHDMREVYPEQFTHIFNLFTSFGYFDTQEDNLRVLQSIEHMLEPGGVLFIDFMNAQKVIANLVQEEVKEIGGITFHIQREYDGAHIFKHIRFSDNGTEFAFTERVQALSKTDFSTLLSATSLQIMHIFGDFSLSPFDAESSDRLILVAKKV